MAYQVLAEGSFSFFRCDFVYRIYQVSSLRFLYPRQRFTYVRQASIAKQLTRLPQSLCVMSTVQARNGTPGFDLYADQRGRIIGSSVAILSLSIIFVFLRLLSRKLSRAGYWVSFCISYLSTKPD